MRGNYQEQDELRARFTGWLDRVLQREAGRYRKAQKVNERVQSLENVPEESLATGESVEYSAPDFDFEEERLAEAFAKLSPKRQQVLTMLFVEDRKPGEIAKCLGSTPESIYLLRYRSIKELREKLLEGGDKTWPPKTSA